MQKRTFGRFAAPVLILGTVVFGSFGALASTASAATQLQICVKNSGAAFVIGEGFKKADCKNNDQLISLDLNSVGPQGPAGPQGPQGPVGNKGPTGDKGPLGDKGPTGDVGPQGPAGAQGIQGIQGPIGSQGPQGDQGLPGAGGTDGTAGPQGPKGDPGPQGDPGAQGATGPAGAQGETGPKGDTGATGAAGTAGAAGTQGAIGPQGPQGTIGPIGPAGSNGTNGTNGNDGKSAYQIAVDNGFDGPNVNAWLVSLVGPQGPKGDTGATGPTGATGATGAAGAGSTVAGPTGPQGPKGDKGDTGVTVESDPIFASSEAALLASGDKAKLDSALQSFTETDPTVDLDKLKTLTSNDFHNLGGTDADTTYDAGTGLSLTGTTFSIDSTQFTGWDTNAADDFDGTYAALSGAPTTVSAFTNDAGYLTSFSELDPVFGASEAALFGAGDKAKLDSALQSFTETDPTIDLAKLKSLTSNDFHNLGGVDADTTYTAGTGLSLVGTEFSLDASYFNGWDTNAADDFDGTYAALSGAPTTVSAFTNDAGYLTTETDPTVDLAKLKSLVTNDFHNLGGVDADTTYTAGTGLTLTGTTFGIDSTQFSGWDTNASNDFNGTYAALTGAPTNVSAFTNDAGYLTSFTETDPSVTLAKLKTLTSNDFHNLGGVDANTTYTAGTGLSLVGTTFNIVDGVFSTGSYANPSWITSLAGSKITGAVPTATAATALAGNGTNCTTAGQFAIGVDASGNAEGCANPVSVYNAAGTLQASQLHMVSGTATLSTANPGTATVNLTGSAVYSSASTYFCALTNQTSSARAVTMVRNSGSQFVITGTGNNNPDVVGYICEGI